MLRKKLVSIKIDKTQLCRVRGEERCCGGGRKEGRKTQGEDRLYSCSKCDQIRLELALNSLTLSLGTREVGMSKMPGASGGLSSKVYLCASFKWFGRRGSSKGIGNVF